MRPRAAAALLLSILFIPRAVADCNWIPRYSGGFRASALDLSLDGAFIWVATGYGVTLYEQNGTAVRALSTVALPGTTRVVTAAGNGQAYAGSGSRVFVIQREGSKIRIAGSAPASGAVNDILIASRVFVATSNGIDHYDVVEPATLLKSEIVLFTTSPNVTSLAAQGSTLYAADGDASVEVFSISVPSLPQHTSTIDAMARATSVHVAGDGRIVVSDRFGQTTDVYAGSTRLSRVALGANAFTSSSGEWYLAGPDRTLRAADFSDAARVATLFEYVLPASGGNNNSIHAIARSGETLYVAAGDIGLVVFDISPLQKPYPLISYNDGATSGASMHGNRAWFTTADKIWEWEVGGNGLALKRSWSPGAASIAQDANAEYLLTSSGLVAILWRLSDPTPQPANTANFPAAIASAVIRRTGAVVSLADGTVWRTEPQTEPVSGAPKAVAVAGSGQAIALLEVTDTATSIVHYYAAGDLSAKTRAVTIPGAAVGGLALDATRAAVFTFTGINLIDLATGAVSVIPNSNGTIPKKLSFAGNDLLVSAGRTLFVYSNAQTLAHAHSLPATVVSMDNSADRVVLATSEGLATMTFRTALPTAEIEDSNRYYSKVVAAGDRVYLFGPDGIDVLSSAGGSTPHFMGSIDTGGIIDVAATESALFTLSGGGTVTAWSRAVVQIAQVTIDEGTDALPRGIAGVGGAVWVSLSKGCSLGTCQKKTLILDPNTLAVTGTMTGGVDDVVESGARAYALTDIPREIRVIDVSDPQHPFVIASTTRPQSAVSIAHGGGKVEVLGDRVQSFDDGTLAPAGVRLTPIAPTASSRILLYEACALVTGRNDNPDLFTVPAWSPATSIDVPSSVRSIAVDGDRLFLLTTHSLEVWSVSEHQPSRRRSAARF